MGLSDTIEAAMKIGKNVRVHLERKLKKPISEYRALERAQEILEKQNTKPNRAPMNVPKINIPKEDIAHNKRLVQEMQAKSTQLLENLEKIHVVSTETFESHKRDLNQHHHARDENTKNKLPKNTLSQHIKERASVEIPKGLTEIRNVVDILHNANNINDNDITTEEIANRFNLRETDIKNLIKYFSLIEAKDKLVKSDGTEMLQDPGKLLDRV